ncbi:family 16 glycosyl hydrolase [Truncatella angustata]|uniref:Family 16 glycosyl hydrolase n=1 Tax=Truncatella angustata TaxID=152316 RepID=A0A9P8UCX6_9PEZI|nr:family 16 glycosyl hydrolase [Truncatella angustata]KAH6646402.1 family 16 glycosyl hydrolase [Truncatella angustata]KAH8200034.1 hypothetical protein TruAng_005810 [Truncatella angustata]
MGLLQRLVGLTALLATAQAVVPAISGFTLTWSDDFTGATYAPPSSSNWITDTGTSYAGGPASWGTGEVQTYTNNYKNLRQTGRGALEIIALKSGSAWTSGRIETVRKDFMAKAGGAMRIQARAALPSVKQPAGYWPAFWTLGAAYRGNYTNWPFIGEFDIMESVNGLSKAFGGMHCGTNPGGECNEPSGLGSNLACSGTACQGNFHIYTLEVDRTGSVEAIRWFLDGTLYNQVTSSQLSAATWAQVAHQPHFVLLNLAMGGGFPNGVYGSSTPLSTTTSGGVYTVDYVAVYNK